jgi:hypothetical protein
MCQPERGIKPTHRAHDMVTETLQHFLDQNGNDQDFQILAIYKSGLIPGCCRQPALLRSVVDGVGQVKICFDDLHSVGVSEQTAPGRDSPPLR